MLDSLPPELLIMIADKIPGSYSYWESEKEEASHFAQHGSSLFNLYRLDLSAFTQVCKATRSATEHVLYRTLCVWPGLPMKWTLDLNYFGGSLPLLLRTLKGREDLAKEIRVLALDPIRWDLDSDEEGEDIDEDMLDAGEDDTMDEDDGDTMGADDDEDASMEEDEEDSLDDEDERDGLHSADPTSPAVRLLRQCTNLHTLHLITPPEHLLRNSGRTNLKTLAARYSADLFVESMSDLFPDLEELILWNPEFDLSALPVNRAAPRLRYLELHAKSGDCTSFFAGALSLCGQSVTELYLNMDHVERYQIGPRNCRIAGGSRLRNLTLDGVQILNVPGAADLLAQLPALDRLVVHGSLPLTATSIAMLPASLRLLDLGTYGFDDGHQRFLPALAVAIASPTVSRRLDRIETVLAHPPDVQRPDFRQLCESCTRVGVPHVQRLKPYEGSTPYNSVSIMMFLK